MFRYFSFLIIPLLLVAGVINAQPFVEVTSPNGGENFEISELVTFTWSDTGAVVSAAVWVSLNDGTDWLELGAVADNDIDWRVPPELSDECLVKVIVTDDSEETAEDQSDAHFSIVLPKKYKSLTPGWSLISLPLLADDMSLGAVLGDDLEFQAAVYGFTPERGMFVPEELEVGTGYFVGTPTSTVLDIEGWPNLDDSYTFDLVFGWNMLGGPFRYTTDLVNAEITVEVEGEDLTMPWADAVAAEIVTPVMYNFFYNEGDSLLDGMYYEKTRFRAWHGYWYLTLREGVSLTIYTPEEYPSPGLDAADEYTVNDWHLQLFARNGSSMDDCRLGVFEGASDNFNNSYDYPEPPVAPVENPIRVYFERENWNRNIGTQYNRDIREPLRADAVTSWSFSVQSSSEEDVTLSWDYLDETSPQGDSWYEFYLVDEPRDMTINMRAEDSYTYQPGETDQFSVRIVANLSAQEDRNVAPSNFSLVDVYPNPFNSRMRVSYAIPAASDVSLKIFNASGQLVEELVNSHHSAGHFQAEWNAQSASTGIYFVRLEAADFTSNRKVMLIR